MSNYKSRDNWNIPLCLKFDCKNRSINCEECIGFSNYKVLTIKFQKEKMKETFQTLCSRLNIPLWKGMEIGKHVKGRKLSEEELILRIIEIGRKWSKTPDCPIDIPCTTIKNAMQLAKAIISARDKKREEK